MNPRTCLMQRFASAVSAHRAAASRLGLALALALGFASANAALIQVSAAVGWSCGTGTGGFESGCEPDVERGWLSFTYDTEVADSDPDAALGLFADAIVDFSLSVEQEARPDLLFTLAQGTTGSIERSFWQQEVDLLRLLIPVDEASGTYGLGWLSLNIARCCLLPAQMPPVNEIPTLENFWSSKMPSGSGVGGGYRTDGFSVHETDWATTFSARVLPEPASLALAGLGLLAALAASRRSRGR